MGSHWVFSGEVRSETQLNVSHLEDQRAWPDEAKN